MRIACLGLLVLFVIPTLAPAADARKKPNIVLIFADDLGWKGVGYQGSDFMETPNLDRLAKESMVFSNGYAAAGNCAPSRACMLSGTYTPRHDVYAVESTDRGPKPMQRLVPIPNKSGLPVSNVTFADALKQAGYVTGIFGKWHLSGKDGALPQQQGFDTVVNTYAAADLGGSIAGEAEQLKTNGEPSDPKGIFSLTDNACQFMEKNKDKPFFLYLAHHAIHTKLEARPETLKKFQEKKPGKQHDNALYAACTYDLDAGVGILLQKLKDLGLEQDTLLVFTSDNGGTQSCSQEPLRGNKGAYYEGGIREPFIVRWPGVTKAGSKSDEPVINIDLYPTFLAAAGTAVPEGKVLDGVSLVPLLKGEPFKRDALFWYFPGYLDAPVIRGRDPVFRSRPVSVIRKGDWKLHLYLEEWQLDGGRATIDTNNAIELYNLKADEGEHNNVATTEKAKRDELLGDLLAWQQKVSAKVPTEKNPQFDPNFKEEKGGKKKKKAAD